jgi:pyruvate,water dikinase
VAGGLPEGEAWLQLPPAATEAEREGAADRAREALFTACLPAELERELLEEYDALARRCGGPVRVAVRSSALLEDSELSFAGQFETVLDVRREELPRAYLRVLASLFEPRGVSYRRAFGVDERELEVAVGVMAMVPAVCGGVAFSRDPLDPEGEEILLHATAGLGAPLVEGRSAPSVLKVHRKTLEVRRAPGDRAACLSDGEAATLARWILRLEEHFGCPQDVEWALDGERRPFLLQARPLLFSAPAAAPPPLPPGTVVLLEGGETACPGAGAGPVVVVDDRSDLLAFPEGAVLVAAHSSPSYVPALRKASAVVTEVGSVLGHMASVAREIGLPALLGAKGALGLPAGRMVTVDAGGRRILDGTVEVLLRERPQPPRRPEGPGLRLLREIHPYLVPLNLTDPRASNFTPLACHSLHDVARYAHERLFQEMFGVGRLVGDARRQAPLLDVFLPMDLYLLDLGGGLSAPPESRRVRRSEVASPLLQALLDGMLHPEIPRYGPRALDAGGFLQVVLRQGLAGPENEPSLRDPCYAVVSDRYVNLAARVGYHFSAVDAYAGEFLNDNYITFRFKGGAADRDRRERRVKAIARILEALGFSVKIANDLVDAHFQKRSREEILKTLDLLGRLLQFMRQMDAAMASDAWVEPVAEAFLKGDYGLKGLQAPPEDGRR